MRMSQDDSSWRASGIKRRDFRHDPSQPESEISNGRKKKNNPREKHNHALTITFLRWQKNYRGDWVAVQKMHCDCGYNRTTPTWISTLYIPSGATIIHRDIIPPKPED